MAEREGITIEFRGETTQFEAAVKQVNGELKQTKSDISLINKELKFDPTNVEKLTQKMKLLKDLQKELKDKVDAYKKAMDGMDKNSKEWAKLNTELQKASADLASINNELKNMPTGQAQALSKELENVGKGLEKAGNNIENIGKKVMVLSGAVIGLGAAGVNFNAQLEKYQTAFTTLIGDAGEAEKAINNIRQDASVTPFSTESLIEANQYLIAAGVNADESRETIMALGDAIAATGGGSNELSRMAQNLQQIKNVGKASAQDIKQFANAGINIYGLLADAMGKTTEQVKDMDISYEVLDKALRKASQEGGKYYGAMANQSQTLSGSISTLKDSFNSLLGELTEALIPIIKQVIQFVNDIITRLKELDPAQKEMITKIGLIIAALGPALVIVGKIVTVAGTLTTKLGGIVKTVGTLSTKTLGIIGVVGTIIAILVTLYIKNEDFRNSVNELAKEIWSKVKPALENLWQICQDGWEILQFLIDKAKELWSTFMDSSAGEVFKEMLSGIVDVLLWFLDVVGWVIEKVRDLFGWFKDLLGISKDMPSKGSIANGGGGMYQSGGYSITMTNNFSVNGDVSRSMLNQWADAITDRVNENLGRMYA